MSSTNRGAERSDADFYPTPPPPTRAFLRWMRASGLNPSLVVDPCAGDGAILRVVAADGYRVGGLELREECRTALDAVVPGGALYGDALAPCGEVAELRNVLRYVPGAVIVTNPPYGKAREFIETWAPCVDWSAWLLRLNFYGSKKRSKWLRGKGRPSNVLSLDDRVAFCAVCKGIAKKAGSARVKGCGRSYPLGTKGRCVCGGTIGDGTDSCEYAWFVFPGRGARALTTQLDLLEVLDASE